MQSQLLVEPKASDYKTKDHPVLLSPHETNKRCKSFFINFIKNVVQGPHIASVTLAAWECNSLDFPEPPYPDEYV